MIIGTHLFLKTALLIAFLGGTTARAETFYSDPVAGTAQGDGSDKAPWASLSDVVKDGKLKKLKAGDILLLRNGNHGNVKLSGDNSATVTIAAASGQTPQLGRLEITQGSKWLLKGLSISPSFAAAPYKGAIVTLAEGGPSNELTIEDCFIYTVLDSSGWTKDEWMKANDGMFVGRYGTNLTQRNNYILNTRFGVSLCAPDSLFEGNVINNFSGDGLRITRDGITAQYNTIRNCYVSIADGDPNHDDLIQCFLFNAGTGTMRKVAILGNVLIGNEDAKQPFLSNPQGVGLFDGPLIDFDIEKNVVLTNHYHGISLYDAVNCKVIDNAVKAMFPQKMMPWIRLSARVKGGAKDNVVKNNMAHAFDLQADASVIAENNVPVTDAAFDQRLHEQEKFINGKFGEFHPVARLSRLGMRKDESAAHVASPDKEK